MLPIQKMLIKENHYKYNDIKYIVIHSTGNYKPTSTALNHYLYFSGGKRGQSAHYFIDKDNIIQIVEDHHGSFHCGDGRGKYGITNTNSIGIEMCVNDMDNIETVIDHTIDLTVYLMKKHNIPLERVVTHHACSLKPCPDIFQANNWTKWVEFKTLVGVKYKGGGAKKMDKQEVIDIVNSILSPGELPPDKTHWSDPKRESLIKKGVEIHDRRPNDYMRRAEAISLISDAVNQTLKIAVQETKRLIEEKK